jgi:uncharacterized protein (DUF1330 family)
MPVYAVALIDIADRTAYGDYERGFMEIFSRHEGRLLAVEETPVVKEGSWPHTRTVLLEFPDAESLDRWYHSEDYQRLAQHRFRASTAQIAVLRGLG